MSRNPRSPLFRNAVFVGLWSCALTVPLAAQPGRWDFGVELQRARRLLAAAELGGKIYTFGGCGSPCFAPPLHTSTREERTVEVFEPHHPDDPQSQDHWSTRRPMPSIVFGAAAAAPGNGKIYLFGGFVTPDSTQEYDPDPAADSWRSRAAMPTPRYGLAAVAVGRKIYVVGGSNGTNAVAALEAYDPDSNTWEQLASLHTARVFLAAAAVGSKIYAIGGSPDCCGNGTTNVVEVYDTDPTIPREERRWSSGPSLPEPLQTSSAAAFGDKIYVLGGFVPGHGAKGSTFALDPANPQAGWIEQRAMPKARDQAPAVALEDGIHVLGGSTNCHCRPRSDHPTFHPEPAPEPPNLKITKLVDVGDACPGETVTYTITVTNDGAGDAHGATVSDPPPGTPDTQSPFTAQLRGATWKCQASPGAACATADHQPSAAHSTPLSDVVDLPAGGQITYTVTGTIDFGASGTISNQAHVRPAEGADIPSTPTVRTVIRRDRLEIHKTEIPARDSLAPLDSVLYEVTVTNHCRIPLPVTVEEALSTTGLIDPRWCRLPGCSPPIAGNSDTSTVPAGGTVTYRVSGTVPCNCASPVATIPNMASASAPGQETMHAEDVDTVSPADDHLQVAIAGPATLTGCSGDYAITVSNLGPCTAPNVVLTLAPTPGLNLVSLSPPCAGNPCMLGNVAAGANSAVTVTARFAAAAGLACPIVPQSIAATARSLCSQTPEPPALSTVTIPCDLAITKSDGLSTAAPGDCTSYSIGVANHGCGDVARAVVTDAFPDQISAKWCRGAGCTPAAIGKLVDKLDLPRGATESYRVEATISPYFVGRLDNTASVSFGDNAPDASPIVEAATDTTTVQPRPGVDAQCTGTASPVPEGGSVTFTKILWNGGPAAQGDNPGDEFTDVIPAGLTLVSAVASSGMITIAPANTVHWNGSIPVDGMVTIDIMVSVDLGTFGMSFCNTPVVNWDADGDGVNESSASTDDRCHPCCFTVTGAQPIPALSPLGLALLAILVAALGATRLRSRAAKRPPS